MSDNKSFAERFAKKSGNFTSQALEKKEPESSSAVQKSLEKKNDLKDIAAVDPQKRSKAELIYLVKGVDAGRNAWYYVLVERLKVQLFLKALNDDIIHLEEYGKILYSAYGDEPPEEITNALKKEYGI